MKIYHPKYLLKFEIAERKGYFLLTYHLREQRGYGPARTFVCSCVDAAFYRLGETGIDPHYWRGDLCRIDTLWIRLKPGESRRSFYLRHLAREKFTTEQLQQGARLHDEFNTILRERSAWNREHPRVPATARPSSSHTLLGVGPDASAREIQQAWRRAAMIHHPDRGGRADDFRKLLAAYQALTGHR